MTSRRQTKKYSVTDPDRYDKVRYIQYDKLKPKDNGERQNNALQPRRMCFKQDRKTCQNISFIERYERCEAAFKTGSMVGSISSSFVEDD